MKKQILVLVLVSANIETLGAESGIKNFFNWFLSLKDMVRLTVSEKNAPEKNEEKKVEDTKANERQQPEAIKNSDEIIFDVSQKSSEPSTQDILAEEELSDDDIEWVVAILWEGSVSSKEREAFLKTLEILLQQELGAQRILRCTRHDVKNHQVGSRNTKTQYTRLKNKWRASGLDEGCVQKVLEIIDTAYIKAVQ